MDKINLHINDALSYIEENYHENITLESISNTLYLNKCYFCTLFKEQTGKSFSNYLNEIRIDKSKELLKNKKLSILEIAHAVGYNNQTYFNSLFKKYTNITPLQYRRETHEHWLMSLILNSKF